ncbi:hypothetical protein [Endozoicomonas sp. 8E]|nr:hypothetical protein [Endozoicomonas sp. 8E]WOG29743.1 hypothetical protein P6910_08830 [Endozoicomonas sp. 8E]
MNSKFHFDHHMLMPNSHWPPIHNTAMIEIPLWLRRCLNPDYRLHFGL